ncbi:hypothetical protein ACGFLS_05835 [Streptomyces abikoensis]|uniref:hypothetical protein n=2 Tax=Streptomyces abikoensis TaxID=97398 RepID=UPI00371131FE
MIVKGMRIQQIRRYAPHRHPLADQVHDGLTVVIVVVVVAVCSRGMSPEALGLVGVVATVIGSRSRAGAGQRG